MNGFDREARMLALQTMNSGNARAREINRLREEMIELTRLVHCLSVVVDGPSSDINRLLKRLDDEAWDGE
jgi:hypothetical protein